ncbi:MAG TPA: hypothetical protein PLP85_00860 [Alcaligenes sp.]|nr:hypothetical protein [Alcaligenes faecalis]HRL20289.1 hypothetical protein [Alcaligenes sp.]
MVLDRIVRFGVLALGIVLLGWLLSAGAQASQERMAHFSPVHHLDTQTHAQSHSSDAPCLNHTICCPCLPFPAPIVQHRVSGALFPPVPVRSNFLSHLVEPTQPPPRRA